MVNNTLEKALLEKAKADLQIHTTQQILHYRASGILTVAAYSANKGETKKALEVYSNVSDALLYVFMNHDVNGTKIQHYLKKFWSILSADMQQKIEELGVMSLKGRGSMEEGHSLIKKLFEEVSSNSDAKAALDDIVKVGKDAFEMISKIVLEAKKAADEAAL